MRKVLLPTPLFLILLITLALRIPNLFEPYWYGDEGIYLAVGEGIRQGLTLYQQIFDHKPPLIYLLAAISGSLVWFKFILIVWHQTTIIIFWKLAGKIFANSTIEEKDYKKAVVLATSLFALLTTLPTLEGNLVNAEILMAGPTLLGFYLLYDEKLTIKRLLLSGLVFSCAFLFKVPAIFDILAIFAFWGLISLWNLKKITQTVFHSFVVVLGILIPVFIITLYFWKEAAITPYLQAFVSQNLSYISSWETPKVGSETGGLLTRAEILGLVFFLLVVFKKFFDKTTLFLTSWLALSIFALLLSGRPYPHYLIQAIPSITLIIGHLVFGGHKYRFLPLPVVGLFLASLLFYKFYYYPTLPYYKNFSMFVTKQISWEQYIENFDSRMPRTYKVAKYIIEHTQPKEKIFIWGTEPELYALSRHLPPTRYVTSFHIIDFNGQEETIAALETSPPSYILKIKSEQRVLPGLDKLLSSQYLYIQSIHGIEIWKRINI